LRDLLSVAVGDCANAAGSSLIAAGCTGATTGRHRRDRNGDRAAFDAAGALTEDARIS